MQLFVRHQIRDRENYIEETISLIVYKLLRDDIKRG